MAVPVQVFVVWDTGDTYGDGGCPVLEGVFSTLDKAMAAPHVVLTATHQIDAVGLDAGWVGKRQVKQISNEGPPSYARVWVDYPTPPPPRDDDQLVWDGIRARMRGDA